VVSVPVSATSPVLTCSRYNRYAGEEGALRGLAERACQVAFVRNTTYDNVCGGGATTPLGKASKVNGVLVGDLRPAWCELLPTVRVASVTQLARAAVTARTAAPGSVFLVRPNSLTAAGAAGLAATLSAINAHPPLLALLNVNGGMQAVAPPPAGLAPGSVDATQATLQDMEDSLASTLPGFDRFLSCHARSIVTTDFTRPYCYSVPPQHCANTVSTNAAGAGPGSRATAVAALAASLLAALLWV